MVDASGEVDLGGLERVVCREVDGQEEDTARVRRVTLQGNESAIIISESVRVPSATRQDTEAPHRSMAPVEGLLTAVSCSHTVVPSRGRQEQRKANTYRSHDSCLPVELQYQTESVILCVQKSARGPKQMMIVCADRVMGYGRRAEAYRFGGDGRGGRG